MSRKSIQKQMTAPTAPSRSTRALEPAPAPASSSLTGAVPFSLGGIPILPQRAPLTVGASGGPHEQEADRVADQLSRAAEAGPITTPLAAPSLTLHRKPTPGQGAEPSFDVSPATQSRIQSVVGSVGQPLPASVRSLYEPRLGHDLSQVRIHTDSVSTDALGARAFTLGKNIVFGAGQYQPRTSQGRHLLAHELTHTVQQRGSGNAAHVIQRQLEPGKKPQQLEKEALVPPLLPRMSTQDLNKEMEALQFLATKPVPDMSEDELEKIYTRPDGKPRYTWTDSGWKRERFDFVTEEQFNAAYVALDKLALDEVAPLKGKGVAPLKTVNEEGLKVIKFNPLGNPRYGADKKEAGPVTDNVTFEQFAYAANALDQLQPAKGPEGGMGPVEKRMEARQELDSALLEARRKVALAEALLQSLPAGNKLLRAALEQDIKQAKEEIEQASQRVGRGSFKALERHWASESEHKITLGSRQQHVLLTEDEQNHPRKLRNALETPRGSAVTVENSAFGMIQRTSIDTRAVTPAELPSSAMGKNLSPEERASFARQQLTESREQVGKASTQYQGMTNSLASPLNPVSNAWQDLRLAQATFAQEREESRKLSQLTQALAEQSGRVKLLKEQLDADKAQRKVARDAAEIKTLEESISKRKAAMQLEQEQLKRTQEAHLATEQRLTELKTVRNKPLDTLKNNTEVSKGTTVATYGATTGDQTVWKSEVKDVEGLLGSKVEGSTKVLSAEASTNAALNFSGTHVDASAQVAAKASLVDVNYEWKWEPSDVLVFDEVLGAKLYVSLKGMVGAEAKAAIALNAGRAPIDKGNGHLPRFNAQGLLAGSGMRMDPNSGKAKSFKAGGSAGAEAFAGAKLSLGLGAAVEWKKKHSSAYSARLRQTLARFEPNLMSVPLEVFTVTLDKLLQWGTPGSVSLLAAEAAIEGSAGIGGKVQGALSWQGGKFKTLMNANATLGLGLGGQLQITLNLIDGLKFLLLAGTNVLPEAGPMIEKKWSELKNSSWFTLPTFDFNSDDKALEYVQTKGLERTVVQQRVQMLQALLSGWVADDEQEAIVKILTYSKDKGTLPTVLKSVSADAILFSLDGKHDDAARKLLGRK